MSHNTSKNRQFTETCKWRTQIQFPLYFVFQTSNKYSGWQRIIENNSNWCNRDMWAGFELLKTYQTIFQTQIQSDIIWFLKTLVAKKHIWTCHHNKLSVTHSKTLKDYKDSKWDCEKKIQKRCKSFLNW